MTLSKELRKSTNSQDENTKSLSTLRVEINNAQTEINKTSKDIDNLGKETEESGKKAEKAGDGFTVFKGILANLGTQAVNLAING